MRMRWRLSYELPASLSRSNSVCAVYYRDVVVGEYCADLLVEDLLLIELKSVKALDDAHRIQCINYLKASGLHLCLLLNFGRPRLEIKRVVHCL